MSRILQIAKELIDEQESKMEMAVISVGEDMFCMNSSTLKFQ